jgi:hypothetical protein
MARDFVILNPQMKNLAVEMTLVSHAARSYPQVKHGDSESQGWSDQA